jgi:hypothetical protein
MTARAPDPIDALFPIPPYPVQSQFAHALFDTLKEKRSQGQCIVGLFGSCAGASSLCHAHMHLIIYDGA